MGLETRAVGRYLAGYKRMKTKIFIPLLAIFVLLMSSGSQPIHAAGEPIHPYLYFDEEQLANLRALESTPSHEAIWNNIKAWADAHISDSPPDEPSSEGAWWQAADTITRYIETMAFMFAMTDDAAYANTAKNWMLSVADWNKWDGSEENGQCVCVIARGMAFGYDVLYSYLTPAERETLANDIARHVNVTYNSWVNQNWRERSGSIPVRAAGFGLAGLGLLNDHPDAVKWLALGVEMANEALSRGGLDGGWYEGLLYAPYGFTELISFLDALKRVEGQDMFNNDFLRGHPYHYIYGTYNGYPLQFEDCNWHEGYYSFRLAFLYRLASEYSDGYAQWFVGTYADQSVMQSYIWKDPNVAATPPTDLPLTKHFRDLGYVIFRTGWRANDLLFTFKSGTSRGHAHPSQNEFGIYYQGKPITCGPGYVSGTELDDTWPHNCLLVDGNGQGQEPGDYQSLPLGTTGVIEQVDVNDPYYRYVRGDGSAVYNGQSANGDLDKWRRHVVFVELSYFVIYDELSASSAKQFDWLLQAPKVGSDTGSILVDGNAITLARDGVKLIVDVLEPASFSYSIISYNNPYGPSSYIKLHPGENASNVHFLTVHFPLTENGSALNTEKVSVGNAIGAKVTDGDNLDLILFSTDGDPVDEYIDLGGSFEAIDGGDYLFESNGVRVQFDNYQVLRLRKFFEVPAPILESPEDGASGVAVKPIFQWSTIAGGDSYELMVSTEANFDNPTISKIGTHALPTTSWQCNVALDYDTTYYWRVRAISGDTCSAWSAVSAFSTQPPEPQSASPPQSPEPQSASPPQPPPPPATPDWTEWLIPMGGVLLLAFLLTMIILVIKVLRP